MVWRPNPPIGSSQLAPVFKAGSATLGIFMKHADRFQGLVSPDTIGVYRNALRTIQMLSPETLQDGLLRARAIGGSPERAVLFYGVLDCALALQADDTLLHPEKAWELYASHVAQLAQHGFDAFVS